MVDKLATCSLITGDPEDDHMSLQEETGAWGDVTFPQGTPQTVMAHLTDEIIELSTEVAVFGPEADDAARARLSEEAADCYLLLLHIAHKCGFDLETAGWEKFRKNQQRIWGEPDHRGVVRHVDSD